MSTKPTIDIPRVDHIGIRVRDLERAMKFYAMLGFSLHAKAANDAVAVVRNEHDVERRAILGQHDPETVVNDPALGRDAPHPNTVVFGQPAHLLALHDLQVPQPSAHQHEADDHRADRDGDTAAEKRRDLARGPSIGRTHVALPDG